MAEDEIAGWHHRLYGHEFEPALGVGDGQGSLACCCPWSRRESDMNEHRTELIETCSSKIKKKKERKKEKDSFQNIAVH